MRAAGPAGRPAAPCRAPLGAARACRTPHHARPQRPRCSPPVRRYRNVPPPPASAPSDAPPPALLDTDDAAAVGAWRAAQARRMVRFM